MWETADTWLTIPRKYQRTGDDRTVTAINLYINIFTKMPDVLTRDKEYLNAT